MNVELTEKAIALRKKGLSYQKIFETLNVPKSTLSGWLRGKQWSTKIKAQLQKSSSAYTSSRMILLNTQKRKDLVKIYTQAEREAKNEFKEIRWFPLFISGISIYWGEGDKINKYLVRVSNVDAELLQVFIKFLNTVCGVDMTRIKAYVLIYPDLKEKACLNYWSETLGLPLENFTRCVKIQGRHKTNRLSYGVCTVYVSSAYLKKKVNVWLKLISNDLVNNKYKL